MAVAYDAVSESHGAGAFSASEASFSWTHTPTGTPKGVVVFVYVREDNPDRIYGATYDGVAMTAVTGGVASDTATEVCSIKTFFLGSSLPTGAKTVSVSRQNTTNLMQAVCVTLTASADTAYTGVLAEQEDQALAEENIDDGSPGTNSVRIAGIFSGASTPPSAGANSTQVQNNDWGALGIGTYVETTAGQGSRPVGASLASDDVAAVYMAIKESGGGGGTTVTPDVASLTLSTFAPTISLSDNKIATPDTASLVLTGFAPTITLSDNKIVTPDTASLVLTGFPPTVVASDHKIVTPGTGSLILTGSAPIIGLSGGSGSSRPYYIDSNANVYWVINQTLGLVEKI